jgi:hypothetical protein
MTTYLLSNNQLSGKTPVRVMNNKLDGEEIIEGMARIKGKILQGDRCGVYANVEFIDEPGPHYPRWIFAKHQGVEFEANFKGE